MTTYKRKPYETEELASQRITKGVIEDGLINNFIERELEITIGDGIYSDYGQATLGNKEALELKVFKYYNDAYNANIADSPRVENIKFENFIKIHNPEIDFLTSLREGYIEGAEEIVGASLWNDTFNQDTGMFKVAGLEGYKRVLENHGPDEGSE